MFPKVTNGNTGQKWVNLTEFFSYMQHVQTCFLRIVNATGFSLPIEGLEIHFLILLYEQGLFENVFQKLRTKNLD